MSPDTTLGDVRGRVQDALALAVAIDGRRDVVASCELPDEKLVADVDRRLVSSVLREVIGHALRLASSRVTARGRDPIRLATFARYRALSRTGEADGAI